MHILARCLNIYEYFRPERILFIPNHFNGGKLKNNRANVYIVRT